MKSFRYLLLFTVGIYACSDQLELEPVSQISSASFWKSESDATGALAGMYVRLRVQAAVNYFIWGEARSEVMARSVAATNGYELYYDNSLNRANTGPDWRGMYAVVHDANLILKYVPSIGFSSESRKNNTLAQAYATRAFLYFTMAKTWGDLPMVTEPTEGFKPETIQKERTPVAEVFGLIKDDLDRAISLFPDNTLPAGRHFWSLPAVQAMKGDVYAWTAKRMNGGEADLRTALSALNEAGNADVALLDRFPDVFDYAHKGNREILMAIRFADIESAPQTIFDQMYISTAVSNIDAETASTIGTLGGNPYIAPSAVARSRFSDDDSRKKATYLDIYTNNAANNTRTYYGTIVKKFDGTVIGGQRQFWDDVILYRHADVLLMKAEVKNALGQDPSAEINQVRRRAYGDNYTSHVFINGSKADNDEAILRERLLELMFEGKRWWDLVRFDRAFDEIPSLQSRKGQNYLLLFPISPGTLSLEPKVRQNPGYE